MRRASYDRLQPAFLLVGLTIGLVAGVVARGQAAGWLLAVARPVGALWLDALSMTVVPLVFALLVTGVAAASRSAAAGPVTARALIAFAVMLTAAALAAAFLVDALLRFWPGPGRIEGGARPVAEAAGSGAWYHAVFPANPIAAAAETAMVPLVVFALLFGFALARIEADLAEALLKTLRALAEAMLVLVRWVLVFGPVGVAALAFGAGAGLGATAFGALGHYVLLVVAACLVATLLSYVWAWGWGGVSPVRFARAVLPAQAVALGTQSSLASLPVMVEAAPRLGAVPETAGIVLPMAVSLFRAASCAANVAVALYCAHAAGVATGPATLILAALVAVPVSLGAVGLPAQISFFATIAPVALAIGAPVTLLPLLLAIEAVPDLFRTLGNVTADLAALAVAGRRRAA